MVVVPILPVGCRSPAISISRSRNRSRSTTRSARSTEIFSGTRAGCGGKRALARKMRPIGPTRDRWCSRLLLWTICLGAVLCCGISGESLLCWAFEGGTGGTIILQHNATVRGYGKQERLVCVLFDLRQKKALCSQGSKGLMTAFWIVRDFIKIVNVGKSSWVDQGSCDAFMYAWRCSSPLREARQVLLCFRATAKV